MSELSSAFFYGTLMAPEVLFSVLYRTKKPPEAIRKHHKLESAVLHDYSRRRVKLADYPAILPKAGHSVRGVLATNLTEANFQKLDSFEGSEYERRTVKVRTLTEQTPDSEATESEEEQAAWAYVFSLDEEDLDKGEWDYKDFRRQRLKLWFHEGVVVSDDLATHDGDDMIPRANAKSSSVGDEKLKESEEKVLRSAV